MPREEQDLWQTLLHSGEFLATEEAYEHGYLREVRRDLTQYVAFVVCAEVYALSITEISEIAKPMETTPVPRTADFVLGVGNVRGLVIPIIDLGRRLMFPALNVSRESRVLIVQVEGEQFGLLVDRVIGVVPIAPEDLEDAPGAIGGTRADFIQALARQDSEILIVLNLAVVLAARDFMAPHLTASRGS